MSTTEPVLREKERDREGELNGLLKQS